MKIIVRQCYLEAGHDYPFSFVFTDWLVKELGKRVRVSKSFGEAYPEDFSVGISLDASSRISEPEVDGPKVFRRDKEVIIYVTLPHSGGPCPCGPRGYGKAVKQLLDGIATGFQRLGLNVSRIVEDTPALIQQFVSSPEMIEHDWDETSVEPQSKKRSGAKTESSETSQSLRGELTAPRLTSKKRERTKAIPLPKWRVPKNIAKRVEEEGGIWEDERFDPIRLAVMSGTSFQGREIPLSWQIEFDPFDERLEAANEKLKKSGIEPDGDGWSKVIRKKLVERFPTLAKKCHCDSETSTCVVWVESEDACRKLIEVVWALMHRPSTASA